MLLPAALLLLSPPSPRAPPAALNARKERREAWYRQRLSDEVLLLEHPQRQVPAVHPLEAALVAEARQPPEQGSPPCDA